MKVILGRRGDDLPLAPPPRGADVRPIGLAVAGGSNTEGRWEHLSHYLIWLPIVCQIFSQLNLVAFGQVVSMAKGIPTIVLVTERLLSGTFFTAFVLAVVGKIWFNSPWVLFKTKALRWQLLSGMAFATMTWGNCEGPKPNHLPLVVFFAVMMLSPAFIEMFTWVKVHVLRLGQDEVALTMRTSADGHVSFGAELLTPGEVALAVGKGKITRDGVRFVQEVGLGVTFLVLLAMSGTAGSSVTLEGIGYTLMAAFSSAVLYMLGPLKKDDHPLTSLFYMLLPATVGVGLYDVLFGALPPLPLDSSGRVVLSQLPDGYFSYGSFWLPLFGQLSMLAGYVLSTLLGRKYKVGTELLAPWELLRMPCSFAVSWMRGVTAPPESVSMVMTIMFAAAAWRSIPPAWNSFVKSRKERSTKRSEERAPAEPVVDVSQVLRRRAPVLDPVKVPINRTAAQQADAEVQRQIRSEEFRWLKEFDPNFSPEQPKRMGEAEYLERYETVARAMADDARLQNGVPDWKMLARRHVMDVLDSYLGEEVWLSSLYVSVMCKHHEEASTKGDR